MAILELSSRERVLLEIIANEAVNPRLLRRAQALIWLSDGESPDEVAERLSVTRRSIYYLVERFQANGQDEMVKRLDDAPRSGRPSTADGIIDDLIH